MAHNLNIFNRFVREAPFFKLLFPFCFGIYLYHRLQITSITFIISVAIFFIIATISVSFLSDYYRLKLSFLKGVFITFLACTFSYILCYFHDVTKQKNWYKHFAKQFPYALVRINSELEIKEKSIKAVVEIKQLLNQRNSITASGDAIIYFKKTDSVAQLHYGDYVLILNKFRPIQQAKNPGSFDYATYCKRNDIYETAYLTPTEWKKNPQHQASILSVFNYANQWTRSVLKKNLNNVDALGLAEALLVGYRKDMDAELTQAYSNAGIVHIVAISGMHIALVYNSFRYLLFLIPFFKKRKKTTIIIAILFMWIFACITGLPASVVRAATMLSFIALGEMFDRKMSIYNNLSLSAFALLCIKPSWIFDVGFQLSYLAVLSLVIFYRSIEQWIFISNKYLNMLWQLIAVTIAAQILTFPLCIYYFHQFPLLFIITNLFAIPLTTIILYGEIVLLLFQFIKPLASLLGMCISFLIHWLNVLVKWFSQMNYAVFTNLNIDVGETFLLYASIFCFGIWLFHKISNGFTVGLLACFCFITLCSFNRWQNLHQTQLIVLHIPKISSVVFTEGDHAIFYQHDSVKKIESVKKYVTEPFINSLGLEKINIDTSTHQYIVSFIFHHKKIIIIKNNQFHFAEKQVCDYLILSKQVKPDAKWISQNFKPQQVILDGSIPAYKIQLWKSIFEKQKIAFHSTIDDGAFVVNLSE
jgi:competence protein ComEC